MKQQSIRSHQRCRTVFFSANAFAVVVGVGSVFCCLSASSQAFAWPGKVVFPGVTYEHRSGSQDYGTGAAKQEIYITYIDTKSPHVSFVATSPAERRSTVSKFAAKVGASVAINTHFYNSSYQPCGMAMGSGVLFTTAYHDSAVGSCANSVAVGPGNQVSFHNTWGKHNGPAPEGAHEVCTGMPELVVNGVVVKQDVLESPPSPSHMASLNPRTAICMHEDGQTMILAVVDGRQSGRTGMKGVTLANFMKSLGCYNAVNLDGGGSTTMFIKGETSSGVVNRPSDGSERTVCCHFGVRIDPNPPIPDAGPDVGPDVTPDVIPDVVADITTDPPPVETDSEVSTDSPIDSTIPRIDASADSTPPSNDAAIADSNTSDRSSPESSLDDSDESDSSEGCGCRIGPVSVPNAAANRLWLGMLAVASGLWTYRKRHLPRKNHNN